MITAGNFSWHSVIMLPSGMAILRSKNDCYHVIEELGKGTFGKVLKAQKKETGQLVAIKVLKNDQMRSRVIRNEIKLLNLIKQVDLDAAHLILFYEHFQVLDIYCLIFELLQQNLYEYQKEISFAPIPLKHIRTIVTQVLVALSKLKELSIIHSDLKPENIALVDHIRYPFRVKVIDFGSASILSEVRHVKEPYIQSRFYRAPEVLLGLPFSEKLDMWSLGCIIAELHFGYPLYPGNNEYDQVKYICDTQGLPDNYLLNAASKAPSFFKYKVEAERIIQWRLKTEEEYLLLPKVKTVERRKYILKSLDHIELIYRARCCYPEVEVMAECYDLKNMVELMKMMLTWDSNKRISPSTALKHPFISLQHLKTHYKNTRYYWLSEQCQYGATHREPPACCKGLCSPSYYQGQIMHDGEEVDKMITQMTGLHIEEYSEGGHLKVTSEASSHQKLVDLSHLHDAQRQPLHPGLGMETAASQLDNLHTWKTSKTQSKSAVWFTKPSTSKVYVEDHAALNKSETGMKQSTAPLMDRVCDSMDGWKRSTEKWGDCSKEWYFTSHNGPPYTQYTCHQVNQRT